MEAEVKNKEVFIMKKHVIKNEKALLMSKVRRLHHDGMSVCEIAKILNINESTVRTCVEMIERFENYASANK